MVMLRLIRMLENAASPRGIGIVVVSSPIFVVCFTVEYDEYSSATSQRMVVTAMIEMMPPSFVASDTSRGTFG